MAVTGSPLGGLANFSVTEAFHEAIHFLRADIHWARSMHGDGNLELDPLALTAQLGGPMATKNLLHQEKDGLLLSDDEALLDLVKIHDWLCNESWWANGREFDVVQRAFTNSYSIGVYEDGVQIAVARIVSDAATFAWLCDVFVDSDFRGRGIGTWLARASVQWAEKNQIKRIILATRDAHEVYSRVGFEPLKNPERWMVIDNRPQAKDS